MNSICLGCAKLTDDRCHGTDCGTWTGCVCREAKSRERLELEKKCYNAAIETGLYKGWKKELKTEICKESDKLLFDYLEHGEN